MLLMMMCLDTKFQSTRPRGRTRRAELVIIHRDYVSIHASSREDATNQHHDTYQSNQFQSTRPRGRTRPRISVSLTGDQGFNPRVLAGGRDIADHGTKIGDQSFNPRVLAGGRDGHEKPYRWYKDVSIHASSREDAT